MIPDLVCGELTQTILISHIQQKIDHRAFRIGAVNMTALTYNTMIICLSFFIIADGTVRMIISDII